MLEWLCSATKIFYEIMCSGEERLSRYLRLAGLILAPPVYMFLADAKPLVAPGQARVAAELMPFCSRRSEVPFFWEGFFSLQ